MSAYCVLLITTLFIINLSEVISDLKTCSISYYYDVCYYIMCIEVFIPHLRKSGVN